MSYPVRGEGHNPLDSFASAHRTISEFGLVCARAKQAFLNAIIHDLTRGTLPSQLLCPISLAPRKIVRLAQLDTFGLFQHGLLK
jgi:hypothetical protein